MISVAPVRETKFQSKGKTKEAHVQLKRNTLLHESLTLALLTQLHKTESRLIYKNVLFHSEVHKASNFSRLRLREDCLLS